MTNWDEAACIGHTDIFFSHRKVNIQAARAICLSCPLNVYETCLEGAMERREGHGVWAGTTYAQRRQLARLQGQIWPAKPDSPAVFMGPSLSDYQKRERRRRRAHQKKGNGRESQVPENS